MEGFCGKSCADCGWRERLGCPGCQTGPGRAFSGDCGIAACCREKGHADCGTCVQAAGCYKRSGRDREPQERQRRAEAETQRRRELDRRAPVLGKWLWLLFWLVVPSVLGELMTNETVLSLLPGLRVPGEALSLLCMLAYGFLLWQLRQMEDSYRTAAVCYVASGIVGTVAEALRDSIGDGLVLVILLPALAARLYGTYREYTAHAAVLDGVDDGLAEKWRKLWVWEIGLMLGLVACVVLVILSAVLGLLALLADLIGILVVGILKLVYLYRTARLFRDHIPSETEALPE